MNNKILGFLVLPLCFLFFSCTRHWEFPNRYLVMRNDYFSQRFESRSRSYYSPVESALFGISNDELSSHNGIEGYYWSPESPIHIQKKVPNLDEFVTHIDDESDIKICHIFKETEDYCIVNFIYKNKGVTGSWSGSNHILFVYEQTDKIALLFNGLFAPEVYYKGSFLYFYEAYALGIFKFNDLNLTPLELTDTIEEMENDEVYNWSFYSVESISIGAEYKVEGLFF